MESKPERPPPTPEEAAAALQAAETSSNQLAEALALPRWFHGSIGAAVAVQIATTAVGLGVDAGWAKALLGSGVVVFAVVAGVQLARLRARNGIWVGGLASRVVFGTASTASTAYVLALGAAIWAAFGDEWWLVAVCALAGGAGYAVSGVRWMRNYRGDPARHSRGESALLLAVLAVPVFAGIVLLVAGH